MSDTKKEYLATLKRVRPTTYKDLEEKGELDSHAEAIEKAFEERKQRYQENGLAPQEANQLATEDYLTPVSEKDEEEESQRLRDLEDEAENQFAEDLIVGLQGYDPNEKGPQEFDLGNGRKVVKTGRITTVSAEPPDPE